MWLTADCYLVGLAEQRGISLGVADRWLLPGGCGRAEEDITGRGGPLAVGWTT